MPPPDATSSPDDMSATRNYPAKDPHVLADLACVQAGEEFFTGFLHDLDDEDVRGPSLLPGWTRAHVIAHLGYNALAITRLVDWASSGIESPMYESTESRNDEIDRGAVLSAACLREHAEHSAGLLDAAWRSLPDERWTYQVKNAQSLSIAISDSVWLRARELWLHAIDLDLGGTASDIPPTVSRRILQDVLTTWAVRDRFIVDVKATDIDDPIRPRGAQQTKNSTTVPDLSVTGALADLLMWATGRGRHGVDQTDPFGRMKSRAPDARRWL
ncbi:maleylpyruvate isomerase family mycothiol-dependent enzyme [Mycolicibacterium goodii]|uniref:maleylpyruvate isomerase family mycothiol-dependent enzyme n=1 Tax=Mycolicibacterium goodii TaxID=134601 RepID=UPI000C25C4D3|nr:maleylpyruvate isomerase [Mycolicibacterium goodii]